MTDDLTPTCPNCRATDAAVFYDSQCNYDAGDVPVGDAAACEHCYENDECPADCNTPHDEPEPNYRGQWTCPETGTTFRVNGESGYYDWSEDSWDEGSSLIHGYWYSHPYESGWYTCDDCCEWVHEDDARYGEYDGTYCSQCYRGSGEPAAPPTCCSCQALLTDVYFDVDAEVTFCQVHAPARGVKLLAAA